MSSDIKEYERNLTERLFVRSFNVDEQGDIWIQASQISKDSKIQDGENIQLKVSKSHPNRNRIFEMLGQSGTDLATFQVSQEPIVPDPDNPEDRFYQVQGIGGLLTPENRKLDRSTYTKELDDAVDTYFANSVGAEATKMIGEMLDDNGLHADTVKQAAFDRFYRTVKDPKARALIPSLGAMNDLEIKKVFENIAETKTGLHSILQGEEVGPNQKTRQIGYHADHSFAMQSKDRGFGTLEEGLSAVGNYAFQGAASDTIQQRMGAMEVDGVPYLEHLSNKLVRENTLVAPHPTRVSEDYSVLAQEFSQTVGGNTLRAYTAAMGADPSSDSIPLMKDPNTPGGDYQRDIVEGLDAESLKENPGELKQANRQATKLLDSEAVVAHDNVEAEQDRAMNEGEPRVLPTGLSPEAKEEAVHLAGAGVKQAGQAIDGPSIEMF